MKRLLLGAALVLIWLVARPQAAAYRCVLTNKCTPLPCEFIAHLNLAKARLSALANAPVGTETTQASMDAFTGAFLAGQQQALQEYRKCAVGPPAPIVSGDPPTCALPTLQERLDGGNTCSEIIEAEYAYSERWQSICLLTGTDGSTIADLQARALSSAQARVSSMQASLLKFLGSCAPDAALSTQLSEAGLDALKQQGQEARQSWKATRAEQAPAYDPNGLPGRW